MSNAVHDRRVRVVVVDHDGGDLTLECLRSVLATEWDPDALDVVLVDNGSTESIVGQVRRELPRVRVVESPTNRGFAGGANLGLHDLGDTGYVALVNNDATVAPSWLRPLVDALAADPALGAAVPKVLLHGRARRIDVRVGTTGGDRWERRDVGVRVRGVRADGRDLWPTTRFASGTWGPEWDGADPFRWTTDHAVLLVPASADGTPVDRCELLLDAPSPRAVTVSSDPGSPAATVTAEVTCTPAWVTVDVGGPAFDVVNSVGTEVTADGHGVDRGYLEEDHGQYDAPADTFGWYGGAVLLDAAYLADVGLFDERLFLYYEDLELSLRGRERGWRYRSVPTSVVRHRHGATSSRRRRTTEYYTERNRLLVLTRHAGPAHAARAAARFALSTLSYTWRDVVAPVARGERPRPGTVGSRARALGGFLRTAPAMARDRRRGRSALKRPPPGGR